MEFEDILLSERHKTASADRLIIKLHVVLRLLRVEVDYYK